MSTAACAHSDINVGVIIPLVLGAILPKALEPPMSSSDSESHIYCLYFVSETRVFLHLVAISLRDFSTRVIIFFSHDYFPHMTISPHPTTKNISV